MESFIEAFKSPLGALTTAVGLVLTVLTAWWRLRESSQRVSHRRERDFLELLKDEAWRGQPAIYLQLVLQRAYGKTIDERDFEFIQTRHNPLELLRDRLRAGHMVRLKDDGSGYVDDTSFKVPPLKWLSSLSIAFASVAFAPMLVFAATAFQQHWAMGIVAVLETVAMLWGSIYLSVQGDAALRVLSLKKHPRVSKPPASATHVVPLHPAPQTSNSMASKRRSRSARNASDPSCVAD